MNSTIRCGRTVMRNWRPPLSTSSSAPSASTLMRSGGIAVWPPCPTSGTPPGSRPPRDPRPGCLQAGLLGVKQGRAVPVADCQWMHGQVGETVEADGAGQSLEVRREGLEGLDPAGGTTRRLAMRLVKPMWAPTSQNTAPGRSSRWSASCTCSSCSPVQEYFSVCGRMDSRSPWPTPARTVIGVS